jgi:hypothetical protein
MSCHQIRRRGVYVTHCSREKDERYKATKEAVTPDLLYTSKRIRRFMDQCKTKHVRWAIFSDLYGVWFPEVKHEWYEKAPDDVTEAEFSALLWDFDEKLNPYSEIFFYYNPSRFHRQYARLLNCSGLAARVKKITHWWEIA